MNEKAIFCLSFLLLMAAQSQSKELVEFWKTSVTLSCPEDSDIPDSYTWKKDGGKIEIKDQNHKIEKFSDKDKGLYSCTLDPSHFMNYIYVKGKVCENCYELEIQTVAGLILGDLLVTGGVVIIVYYWAQRKSGSPPLAPASRPGRPDRPPPVPNPDYEPLRTGAQDLYSGLHKNH